MTQCERVLRHMEDYGSITGVDIDRVFETSKNRYGETVSYARYFLKEANDGTAS